MKAILFIVSLLLVAVVPAVSAEPASFTAFAGDTGAALSAPELMRRIESADIVLFGEKHTDARGHALQNELLRQILGKNSNTVVSLEEFDRSQQVILDGWLSGSVSDAELEAERDFLNLTVKRNWSAWYLPKLHTAKQYDAALLASNAPLKYSRLVRNYGCDNLPELSEDELSLFDCPGVALDEAYLERFTKTMQGVAGNNKGIKSLSAEQAAQLFRAHRVWDATMAESIVTAHAATGSKVVHIVGDFHVDFNGGLLQELQARAPEQKFLTISFYPRRSAILVKPDAGRADVIVYTR